MSVRCPEDMALNKIWVMFWTIILIVPGFTSFQRQTIQDKDSEITLSVIFYKTNEQML